MKRLSTLTFAALTFAAAALALTGCVSSPVPPPDSHVTLAPEVTGEVRVTDLRRSQDAGGYPTLQANVANLGGSPYPVEWRVRWYDASGVEIDSAVSTWNSLMLQPFALRSLKATASRTDAADMMLYVRRAK